MNGFRRFLRSASTRDIALSCLFALGIVWFGYLLVNIVGKEERARRDVAESEAALASLSARESTLKGDLDALHTERGSDAALRDTLGVARPGEEVIIVVPPASDTYQGPAPSFWQKLYWWLGF